MRLKCNKLKDNLDGKEALINTFSQIPSVSEISVNQYIGTITIKYNPEEIEAVLIIGIILKILDLEEEVRWHILCQEDLDLRLIMYLNFQAK